MEQAFAPLHLSLPDAGLALTDQLAIHHVDLTDKAGHEQIGW